MALMKLAKDIAFDESKGKPELTADLFEELSTHKADAITSGGGKNGGDIQKQIASMARR